MSAAPASSPPPAHAPAGAASAAASTSPLPAPHDAAGGSSSSSSADAGESFRRKVDEVRRSMYAVHESGRRGGGEGTDIGGRSSSRGGGSGRSGTGSSRDWRLDQLDALERLVTDNVRRIQRALHDDLGRDPTISTCTEVCTVLDEIRAVRSLLGPRRRTGKAWPRRWWGRDDSGGSGEEDDEEDDFSASRAVPSPMVCFPARTRLRRRPLAAPGVLIIGPSNYPFSLSVQPAIGSIAMGNPTLIKPSEKCPATSRLLCELVPRYFPGGKPALQAVTGGISETEELLSRRWGLVFFTGSPAVGKIVAGMCAKTLTPAVLECGGKCPAIVDGPTAPPNLGLVADRIVWAKTLNAGQTCAAVDYAVVHRDVANEILPLLVGAVRRQFPGCFRGDDGDDNNSKTQLDDEIGRIVTVEQARRLYEMLEEVEQQKDGGGVRVLIGGTSRCDVERRYICPTVVAVDDHAGGRGSSSELPRLLREEIFGPILPVYVVESRSEAVELVKRVSGYAPLCLYVFTCSSSVFESVCDQVRSGSCVQNDCLIHLSSSQIPFGGLGISGYGKYHGVNSLETFSQLQPLMYRPTTPGADFRYLRYQPLTPFKRRALELSMKLPYMPVLLPQIGTAGASAVAVAVLAAVFLSAIAVHRQSSAVIAIASLIPASAVEALRKLSLRVAEGLEDVAAWIRNHQTLSAAILQAATTNATAATTAMSRQEL